jgi:hypothetical protein
MPLIRCELCKNRRSRVCKWNFAGIFLHSSSDLGKFTVRNTHKNLFSDSELRGNRHSRNHAQFRGVNEFICVFAKFIVQFWYKISARWRTTFLSFMKTDARKAAVFRGSKWNYVYVPWKCTIFWKKSARLSYLFNLLRHALRCFQPQINMKLQSKVKHYDCFKTKFLKEYLEIQRMKCEPFSVTQINNEEIKIL